MGPSRPLSAPPRKATFWLDTLLFGGIVVACMVACMILMVVAVQAPEVVRAAYQPTATQAFTPTPTRIGTATVVPTTGSIPSAATELPSPTATRVVPGEPPPATSLGSKRVQLDLSLQTLTAYEGETVVLTALVSTGVRRYPTPPGEYRILRKVRIQAMSGPSYYVPNVEWVSYFLDGYAIHGTYWHNNFGHPMSHGCVNMRNEDARWIYEWAPLGTPVSVYP